MTVEILSDAMKRIASADQEPEELGSGFGGTNGPAEGPVWFKEHGYLLFSDIHGSRRMKWDPKDGISVDAENTANANGMTRDRQGRLVICHHFSRCVDRIEADGSVTVIADRYRGLKLNRPNDVVVKSDGSIYFSDPPPRPPLTPPEHTPELDIAGVYRVSADLKQMNMIIRDFVNLCDELGATVEKATALDANGQKIGLSMPWWFWNFFGQQAVFLLKR